MEDTRFWALVDEAKSDDADETAENIVELLADWTDDALVELDRFEWKVMRASHLNRLWGAAYLINGGCSDDGFDYFCGWLIAQGQTVFERALVDPDSLVDVVDEDGDVESCDMIFIAARVYEMRHGRSPETGDDPPPYPDDDDDFDFDDGPAMKARFPKLWAVFGWDDELS